MKTGNAILMAFFIWLAYDMPMTLWVLSREHGIYDFLGVSVDNWLTIVFMLLILGAIVFCITGFEKKKELVDKVEVEGEPVSEPVVEKEPVSKMIVEPEKEPYGEPVEFKPIPSVDDVRADVDKLIGDKE